MRDTAREVQLREEFNRWATSGRGEEMADHHLPIVLPMLALMDLQPSERLLDAGCGAGWLCRMLAERFPQGEFLGIDSADEMVQRARRAAAHLPNVSFEVGGVDKIPAPDAHFTKVISVESAYYWPDPAQGVREIFRVLAPGGSAWILINYYRDNPYCHQWGPQLPVRTYLYSAEEWCALLREAGFVEVVHRRIPDESPTPEVYSGRWFRDADEMRKFKREGALLVVGKKPTPSKSV